MYNLLTERTQSHFSKLILPRDDVVGDAGQTEKDGDDDAGTVAAKTAVQDDGVVGLVAEVQEDGAQGGTGVSEDAAVGVAEAVLGRERSVSLM